MLFFINLWNNLKEQEKIGMKRSGCPKWRRPEVETTSGKPK